MDQPVQATLIEALLRPKGVATTVSTMGTACCSCQMRHACWPCGLAGLGPQQAPLLTFSRHRLRAGEPLYRKGDAFHRVHAVRSGSLKTSVTLPGGRTQVCGFQLPGDMVGLDGMADGAYQTTATAMEDTQTCAVAYGPLVELAQSQPLVQRDLHRVMSREVAKGQWHMLLLGSMSAPERLAALLLDLSRRAAARGYSPSEFNLRMTRSDIGSYLGVSAETICRLLREFKDLKLLEVDTRHIRFLDLPAFARAYSATVHWHPHAHAAGGAEPRLQAVPS